MNEKTVIDGRVIYNELRNLGNEWARHMETAIREVDLPRLDDGARSAAWLSFGSNLASELFPMFAPRRVERSVPARLAAAGLRRVAVPVMLLSQVQAAFADTYHDRVERQHDAVYRNFLDVRGELHNIIARQGREFPASDYGRVCFEALNEVLGGREEDDELLAGQMVQQAIEDANLINLNFTELAADVKAAFKPLVEKIELIHKNSPAAQGFLQDGRLQFAPSGEQYWDTTLAGEGYTRHDFRPVHRQEDALWLMANAYRMRVWERQRDFTRSGRRLPPTTYVVLEYPNRKPRDFIPSIDNVEGEVREALRMAVAGQRSVMTQAAV